MAGSKKLRFITMRQLFIKQKVFKITDHYPVLDANGTAVYFVDETFKLFGKKIQVTRPDGSPVFTITRELFRFLYHFHARFSDGKKITLKQKFKFFRMGIDVMSDDYRLTLEGDFLSLNFSVFSEGKKVGSIYRKWLSWGDSFTIDVIDPSFEEELLALMIMVDFIRDQQEKAH